MKADDDGFVGSPKKIVRAVNCTEDDLKLLITKGFVICFESGVVVITHWNVHNTIKNDRYTKTIFQDEFAQLQTENKTYLLPCKNTMEPERFQNGSNLEPQIRLGKIRLDKDRVDSLSADADAQPRFDYQAVVDSYHAACVSLPKVQKLSDNRRRAIRSAHRLLDGMTFDDLFTKVEQSDFLTGRSGSWKGCGFDWILKQSNLLKIIEGNYDNKEDRDNRSDFKDNKSGAQEFIYKAGTIL